MHTVNLTGGFGNQLFQFANAVSISLSRNSHIKFQFSDHKRLFELDKLGIRCDTSYLFHISNQDSLNVNETAIHCRDSSIHWQEPQFTYNPIPELPNHASISGFFQSYKYFDNFKQSINRFLKNKLLDIETNVEEQLIIHVRLGDMYRDPISRKFHGFVDDNYIKKVREYFGENIEFSIVTDFHDELAIALPESVKLARKVICSDFLSDFQYLASARNLAISNSTFSWWAAYLSGANVVAPKLWFSKDTLKTHSTKDLFPEEWRLL
jgi:hypothetical protein